MSTKPNWTCRDSDTWAERLTGPWEASAEIVKQNKRRTVYRAEFAGDVVYIKHDHPRTPRDRVKCLWRCKARVEFEQGVKLEEAKVPTVRMLAWGQRGCDSFLASQAVDRAVEGLALWPQYAGDANARQRYLRRLADFLRALRDAGVSHTDFHPGNVLSVASADGPDFYLVDVYNLRVGHVLSDAQYLHLVVWLGGRIHEFTREETYQLFEAAGVCRSEDELDAKLDAVSEKIVAFYKAKWPGRRRRFLKSGSMCQVHRTDEGVWRLCPSLALSTAQQFLESARTADADEPMLKTGRKRLVRRVRVGDDSCIVKEFTKPGPWGRLAADGRSWLNSNRLATYGVPAAKPLAWFAGNDGRGFVLLTDLGDRILHTELKIAADAPRRRQLLCALAQLLAQLHTLRILHRDLKLANIMAVGSGPDEALLLVDMDDVRFGVSEPEEMRLFNLRQILESMPEAINSWWRLYFLVKYCRLARLGPRTSRRFYDAVREFVDGR